MISRLFTLALTLTLAAGPGAAFAQKEHDKETDGDGEGDEDETVPTKTQSKTEQRAQAEEAERLRVASSPQIRRFHEVLDELLAEFGYDVKMGQIKGLANLSVRKVRVSKAIPNTYEDYVETLLDERIKENSQIKLIACVPCKARTSSLVDGKLLITSPATNLAKLDAAAAQLGIENFMDAVLVYHTTHMVLAVSIFNTQSKELVWARTYNSETVRSRYQKLAVDYSQVAKSRTGEDYEPDYRFMFGAGGAAIPNVAGSKEDSQFLNLQIRATEKFNNRKSEFGLLLSVLKSSATAVKSYPTETSGTEATKTTTTTKSKTAKLVPFRTAGALYAAYGHLFVGSVESYNQIRHGLHAGVGMLGATGYLAPVLRFGWDIFMGRRFSTSLGLNYVAASSVIVETETIKTKGGAGADAVLSFNY